MSAHALQLLVFGTPGKIHRSGCPGGGWCGRDSWGATVVDSAPRVATLEQMGRAGV